MALIVAGSLFGAEGEKPVPQPLEVQSALAQFEKQVVASRKVYDLATLKAASDSMALLEKARTKYMAANDLEGALLVNKAIEALKNGETLGAVEENIKKAGDLLGVGKGDLRKELVGKWREASGSIVEINADGSAKHPITSGKWNIKNNKLIITWNNGVIYSADLPSKNNTLFVFENNGSWLMTKILK